MAKYVKGPTVPQEETYVISLSIVLSGSKKLTDEQKEALLSTEAVRLIIADAPESATFVANLKPGLKIG